MSYKSKDSNYMRTLKKAVLKGMRGHQPDQKIYTWNYIRKQVALEDLKTETIQYFNRLAHFPQDHFNARVVMIFTHPIGEPEARMIQAIKDREGILDDDLYVTYVHKTETNDHTEQALMYDILIKEMDIIEPDIMVAFGPIFDLKQHAVTTFRGAKSIVTYPTTYIFGDDALAPSAERKKSLLMDMQNIMQHYKSD